MNANDFFTIPQIGEAEPGSQHSPGVINLEGEKQFPVRDADAD